MKNLSINNDAFFQVSSEKRTEITMKKTPYLFNNFR